MPHPRTRHSSAGKLTEFVGCGKEFHLTEVPTLRAVIQRGLLIKERLYAENDTSITTGRGLKTKIIKELATLVSAQWHRANAKFRPPVTIKEKSLVQTLERNWTKVENVAWSKANPTIVDYIMEKIDKVFDITVCPHTILLCNNPESGCTSEAECLNQAHIKCNCRLECKIPPLELRWLFAQRNKCGEMSEMMMAGADTVETKRQNKAEKRKATEADAKLNKKNKTEEEEMRRLEHQDLQQLSGEEDNLLRDDTDDEFKPTCKLLKEEEEKVMKLVDRLLHQKLGDCSHLVTRYLNRPIPKRNLMPVLNTAKASLRRGVSPAATADITTGFLKDLIAAGILQPEMSYLACDPSKIERARKGAMSNARDLDQNRYMKENIEGFSYDGRKDKHTRAIVTDSCGKTRMRMVKEEHVSVSEEPKGRYLSHFVPDEPTYPEKPAFKVAQALYDLIVEHNSLDSIMFLAGDSTNSNTGWKGGSHAHLEKLLGRKLFWGICNIHTHELPLRHLIRILDGPTASDVGFTGEVCSLLSHVNKMPYNSDFEGLPEGEDLRTIPDDILKNLSTDQKICYKLVNALKAGELPTDLQDITCGTLNHARWLTTGQRLIYMWTRKHGLSGNNLKVLRLLVNFCLQYYFPVFFDIKAKHHIEDAPYHLLTQLRILRTQPKKVQDAVTYYVRTGAWYSHPECLLLSLLASTDSNDRNFAVNQILKLRGHSEYGDSSVRPRVTPKINLRATSLIKLITWKPELVAEPVFTCNMTKKDIEDFRYRPYQAPKFSCNTQSTERCVKLVTEAAAHVAGKDSREGYIRAQIQHREAMPVFLTKRDILCTFDK